MVSHIVNETTSTSAANTELPLGVVTVTYSPGPYLDALLRSLDKATRSGTYTVLADNGSSDGVPQEAAAAAGNVEFLDTGGNIGYGAGMNAGAARLRELVDGGKLRGDYLLLVNPDVAFHPGSVDELIACAQSWPGAGAVGPRIEEPDGSSYPSARAVPTLGTGIGHALLSGVWPANPWSRRYRKEQDMTQRREAGWLSGACVLVRWDAFTEIGGFDERYFMYLEDVDLGDRLSRAGWCNVFCPEAVITHAQGHSTKRHARAMTKAHHQSAYRFQADRLPQWWQAPVRWLLKIGLDTRALCAKLQN
ncbi:alpha-D-GlcNAc-diphosphoryl polyprenol, alpha-3-L-rhamnosyl transferase [Corynebacterium phocae]|uniref:Alpha-D-GlcNAc-diphosphoryl polyprenol, alpha-3-L-rhamnosyl transferase n=1 Tax=Corynebacterium phocae TaxID=161895 RepID=A0A1L7D4Q8_9CORY|nr:glycosyltransferase family 2 protein [Corynebacterium phocae]APT93105.1 alpha-D-GlcNAc-diphosphoryl polyprenol, alpha-3-L-rhamnosyl transferase [Corynebacterium phocae]KAA8722409.1 glycosyltransferase family 2 protein [Corynebacterium phocae]